MFTLRYIPKGNLKDIASRYPQFSRIGNLRLIEKYLWKHESEIPSDKFYLIDKRSFEKEGKFWRCVSAPGTTIVSVNTLYGKSIHVIRKDGGFDGFSLQYVGPEILYYANHTYKISFKIKFSEGDFNSFNIGWWVNDGNKGFANTAALEKEIEPIGEGWYKCTSKYTFIDNHFGIDGFFNSVAKETSFIISDFELIDLNYNPKLPRYVFEVKGNEDLDNWLTKNNTPSSGQNLISNGNFEIGIAFWKFTSKSGIDIKIENVEGHTCAFIKRSIGNGGDWSLFYAGRPIEYKANNEYQIAFKFKPIQPKIIPFKVGFWVDEGEGYKYNLNLKIDTLRDGWLDIKASYIFKKNQNNLMFPINSQMDNSQFYITDLSLSNLTQTQYQMKPVSNPESLIRISTPFSDRTSRWRYAAELWKTDYKWYNKLIGHGYDFLVWYGHKFNNNSPDWPHNPFISVLLYSGLLGLLFYIWLLTKVVILYLKYRKLYVVAFIGFLVTFFFSFFSGSSPFDPPIMGFFIMLPFFIHSVHKNDINKSD